MHGSCITVNINRVNHNSDVTCSLSNLLNSTNFVLFVNNAMVIVNVDITQRKPIFCKK